MRILAVRLPLPSLSTVSKRSNLYLPEDELATTKAAWRLGAPTPDVCKAALTDFMIEDPVWMRHFENMLRDDGIGAVNEFVNAFNSILDSKNDILEDCRLMQTTLTDCSGIDAEIESLLEEIDVVTELTKRCITENSQTVQNQEEYATRYNGFVEQYENAKAQLEQLRTTKIAREAQAEAIGAFIFEVQELDTLTKFDEKIWLAIIDMVTVHADGRMTFKFQGDTEIDA